MSKLGKKKASSLAAVSLPSLAWMAFIFLSVPNCARKLRDSEGNKEKKDWEEEKEKE